MADYSANPLFSTNMFDLFYWAEQINGIGNIVFVNGTVEVDVIDMGDATFRIKFLGSSFAENPPGSHIPSAGTYSSAEVLVSGGNRGKLENISPEGNFADINDLGAYHVLDGNDVLQGANFNDTLFSGYGGNDQLSGEGADDALYVSALSFTPTHVVNGGAGNDTLFALTNLYDGATTLDLRSSQLVGIESIALQGVTLMVLDASDIGGIGVSSSAQITSMGPAALQIIKSTGATLNLSGWNVDANTTLSVFGSAFGETIQGTNVFDHFLPGAGVDTVNGNGGNDTFEIAGAEGEFDALNGGAGADTLRLSGSGAVTLNGFNPAGASIESLEGNGLGIIGNGGNNSFDLSGLASVSGLAFIDGGAGDDTIVGSTLADILRGGIGKDTLTGGGAGDSFDFNAAAELGKKKGTLDRIADFTQGADHIDFLTIDANGAKKGDKAFKFVKKNGADFTEKAGQLIYKQIDKAGIVNDLTLIQADTNGNGKADFKLELTGLLKLTADDFVL